MALLLGKQQRDELFLYAVTFILLFRVGFFCGIIIDRISGRICEFKASSGMTTQYELLNVVDRTANRAAYDNSHSHKIQRFLTVITGSRSCIENASECRATNRGLKCW